jgi:hypothetical protein
MADQLADPADLATILERTDISIPKATILVEIATSIVQEAAGNQRIVQVVDDQAAIMGTSESWLDLPQRPVTAVTSVAIDGTALVLGVDYKVFGNRLWGRRGWQTNLGIQNWALVPGNVIPPLLATMGPEPSGVAVIYTHGYAAGSQDLQLARGSVLSICTAVYGNPAGLKAESIDDYAATYAALSGQLEISTYLKAALRRKYGPRGRLVRIG